MTKNIADKIKKDSEDIDFLFRQTTDLSRVVSTGSTLLDLAISGKAIQGGGLPGGIIVEIYGPSGSGKTAIITEIAAAASVKGGSALYLDPEARLNHSYAEMTGLQLNTDDYHRPDTVEEMFDLIWDWEPEKKDNLNLIAADSLAALSTNMEMADTDKFGMRRAKMFSEGFRRTARKIGEGHKLIVCSNQVRDGDMGEVTPGGRAIAYYCTVRIRIGPSPKGSKLEKSKTIGSKSMVKQVGIRSECIVKKNSLDDPFRKCDLFIMFGYGIDDIRGNLQYIKDIRGLQKYLAVDKEYKSMQQAVDWIEENSLEVDLKDMVIEEWTKIEKAFSTNRPRKQR